MVRPNLNPIALTRTKLIHLTGGFPKFIEEGYNKKHLALYMQESGYNTYYVGKLFNSHSIHNYNDPPMSGYTGSEFFLEPYTYQVRVQTPPTGTQAGADCRPVRQRRLNAKWS